MLNMDTIEVPLASFEGNRIFGGDLGKEFSISNQNPAGSELTVQLIQQIEKTDERAGESWIS